MNATRFLLVGAPALAFALMTSAAMAQQTDSVDPDEEIIWIEDQEALANHEDIIADGEEDDVDVIAIEDLDSLENPEESIDIIVDGGEVTIEAISAPIASRDRARERRADRREARRDVVARSEDNACYHAPFSRLSYCQTWLQSN